MASAAEPVIAPKAKGGIKKIALIGAGALVLAVGGAAGGVFAAKAGLFGGGSEKAHEDDNKPKLVPRADESGHSGEAAGGLPSKFKASYYEIEKNFTSNLADTEGFMQVSIGVSTLYDAQVIENLKANEMPVRSAVLMTLSNQEAYVISTPDGKRALQKQLKEAINKALEEKTGFGGVDAVYFTSFVIQ